MRRLLLLIAACCPPPPVAPPKQIARPVPPPVVVEQPKVVALDNLVEGQQVAGFTTKAVYLDGANHRIGARFVHPSGFVFDYLRIESAPQGFLWVTSIPTSDKGEPHTQEHLLLGKGNRGRQLGSFEAMALAQSSAFTAQWHTAYHFHTVAGADAFWPEFANELGALLHPDYTDEEIRREVRNFGVDKGDGGKLRLEEKGTVYNEMVRAYEGPDAAVWRAAGQLVYGDKHPLAFESGGFPEAIRTMTPEDIRKFHDDAYHLPNMGMIGAFPSVMALPDVLANLGKQLEGAGDHGGTRHDESQFPAPAGAPAGKDAVVEFPYSDAVSPGQMLFAWPATRKLDDKENTLLELFMSALAGDDSTPLYQQLIASKTRKLDLGATGVFTMLSYDQGQPVFLALNGVKADRLDAKTLDEVRALIHAELEKLAALPDGDPQLVAFDARVASRALDERRKMGKLLDSPPGFGIRGTGSQWLDKLIDQNRNGGFEKSLVNAPALAYVDAALAKGNPWRDRLKSWGLLEAPYGVAAKPSPALRKQLDAARDQRSADELARLQKQYGAKDAATTLARYQADYLAATPPVGGVDLPPLVANPPMTLDDLKYTVDGKRFTATIDSMQSARIALHLDLAGVDPALYRYLPALPSLLSDVGMMVNGAPVASSEVRERQRKEILSLEVGFAGNPRTDRHELVIAGAGSSVAETTRALAWMEAATHAPDWRPENLPRIRDVVDQLIVADRQRTQGPEESWVDQVREDWYDQDQPLGLHTESFLVGEHDLLLLKWELRGQGDTSAAQTELARLAKLSGPRTKLSGEADRLAKSKDPLLADVGKDLALRIADLPDRTLVRDFSSLCMDLAAALKSGAPTALHRLEQLRAQIARRGNARVVEVGAKAHLDAVATARDSFLHAALTDGDVAKQPSTHVQAIAERTGAKLGKRSAWGLLVPGTSSGVVLHLAKAPSYLDAGSDAVSEYLASNLYTGHGAHSMFIKTWAAGLAYSNGLHSHLDRGTIDYYAERVPLLPQTLKFVVDQLKAATPDANIGRYAIAQAFRSRIADDYEGRAEAMAADLVDGLTPEVVAKFRTGLLALAKQPDFYKPVFDRMPVAYGKVVPGYGVLPDEGSWLVIGPQKQLDAYATYMKPYAPFTVLYPRDFWLSHE